MRLCFFAKLSRRWSSLHHFVTFSDASWARKLEVPITTPRWRWPSVVNLMPVLENKRWASCKFPWSFKMSQLFFSFTKYPNFLPSEITFFHHIIRPSRLPAPDISFIIKSILRTISNERYLSHYTSITINFDIWYCDEKN